MRFDKHNGLHFFSLFIIFGALTFAFVSLGFVKIQSHNTASEIVRESNASRFSSMEHYFIEFLKFHQKTLNEMVSLPLVQATVLEGVSDKEALRDTLANVKVPNQEGHFCVYDVLGDSVYWETKRPAVLKTLIQNGIKDESLFDGPSYTFFRDEQKATLVVTMPISYNGNPEGLGIYTVPLDNNDLPLGKNAEGTYWFGLNQSHFDWEMSAPEGWESETHPIPGTDLSVTFAVSPTVFSNAENKLFSSLFSGLSLATLISITLLYFIGKKYIVSPYQSLYESQLALAEKERQSTRLARVAKHMRDAVVFTNTDINITWVNKAFEQLSGYRSEELIGKKPSCLLQGEKTSPEVTAAIREAINQETHGQFELVNYHKSGRAYWIEVAITPLYDDTGCLEGFMAVERDITHRVKLENELQQKAIQAEAASTAKSRFLATMSHELRTPMNGILGMGELLEESDLNQDQAECVSIQMQSGRHMLSVLNDILDFSKIESSEIQILNVRFPLKNITQGIKDLYEPLCREKGISFEFSSNVDVRRTMLLSDDKRLIQILQNLVGNALKFTSAGFISLETKISGKGTDGELTLIVTDSGIGIDESKLEKIFKPFAQAEEDTTRQFGGTGLGLAITSEITKAMGGTIQIDSQLGKGSQFTVTIPLKHVEMVEPDEGLHTEEAKPFDGSGYRALIVEDNSVNAILLKRHLVNRNFDCSLATDGEIGLNSALNNQFDCIFMDNHMPIRDGIEVTALIRKADLAQQPIIFGYTADAFDETRKTMLDSGCNEVLTKPCNTKILDTLLTKHLSP